MTQHQNTSKNSWHKKVQGGGEGQGDRMKPGHHSGAEKKTFVELTLDKNYNHSFIAKQSHFLRGTHKLLQFFLISSFTYYNHLRLQMNPSQNSIPLSWHHISVVGWWECLPQTLGQRTHVGEILCLFQTSIFSGPYDQWFLLLSGLGVLYHLLFHSPIKNSLEVQGVSHLGMVWIWEENETI